MFCKQSMANMLNVVQKPHFLRYLIVLCSLQMALLILNGSQSEWVIASGVAELVFL